MLINGKLNADEKAFFTATRDDTEIFLNGSSIPYRTLDLGETVSLTISSRVFVRSTAPIYVMQYTGIGCEIGCAMIPPVNCRGTRQLGFTRSQNEFFYLNILVQDEGADDFKLNGSTTAIQSSDFVNVPGTAGEWQMAQIEFPTSVIGVGSGNLIENDSNSYQVGILEGDLTTGSRYGYFSNFASLYIGDDFSLCVGDTQTIQAIADPSATYLWSTGATTDQIAVYDTGTYWVEMTNPSGCVLYDTITVTQTPPAQASLGPDITACEGQRVTIRSGDVYFVDEWSTGATSKNLTVTTEGQYSVEMFDLNGCPVRDTVEVFFKELHEVNLGNDIAFCDGDTTTLSLVTNAVSPTYLWDNGATTSTIPVYVGGTYQVEVTDGPCVVSDTIAVTVNPIPEVISHYRYRSGLSWCYWR
jgi:hypothetical protein